MADLNGVVGTISSPIVKTGGSFAIKPVKSVIPIGSGRWIASAVTVKGGTKVIGKANSAKVPVKARSYTLTMMHQVKISWEGCAGVIKDMPKLTVRTAVVLKAPGAKLGMVTPGVLLAKGTYTVATKAKDGFTYTNKEVAYGYRDPVMNASCVVTDLGKLLQLSDGPGTLRGEARYIAGDCTGNLDGKTIVEGLLHAKSRLDESRGFIGAFIRYLDLGGRNSFSDLKGTATVKKGQKFTCMLVADKIQYKSAAVMGSGTTPTAHAVRIK
ncbi:hypothetical protein [Paeniglutamicibacter cryotolerans]|uniref:Uncharacterized protein n=1 Tax=Paeniglutamicibacter cryotolerans TaxID=670079 RepID=A0A839QUL2_9MICC|nr:hypothetical protein [Paeniglutamicibacter cryotolerans]MBB2996972.1 hypothetical protein [Paeniglutamicibacter cryotolerans]